MAAMRSAKAAIAQYENERSDQTLTPQIIHCIYAVAAVYHSNNEAAER